MLRETLIFLDLDVKGTDLSYADAVVYFRWRHALQSGRPVKKIFIPWRPEVLFPQPVEPTRLPDEIMLHARRLCYRQCGLKEIVMLNLETGERSIFASDDDDLTPRKLFALSDRYVVQVA